MNKVDISVNQLVGMVERGELRLPEMQRRYVWRATRVRDLLDSLYRGYPSGSILVWETEQEQPTRDLAVSQNQSPFAGHKLLLDGQQRLTLLSAILRGEPVQVRGRRRSSDILFNLNWTTQDSYTSSLAVDPSPFGLSVAQRNRRLPDSRPACSSTSPLARLRSERTALSSQ